MPDPTQLIIDFATEQFVDVISNTLDDPSWLEHPDGEPGSGIMWFDRMRTLAVALHLDFDAVVRREGTDFEVARLQDLEHRLLTGDGDV